MFVESINICAVPVNIARPEQGGDVSKRGEGARVAVRADADCLAPGCLCIRET